MREIIQVNAYKKDLKRCLKRNYDIKKLLEVVDLLATYQTLPAKYRDHKMIGDYHDCRNCHLSPDWILLYRLDGDELHLVRTGSHSDLF